MAGRLTREEVIRVTATMTPGRRVVLRVAGRTCRLLTTPADGRRDKDMIPTTGTAAISRHRLHPVDREAIRLILAADTRLMDMAAARAQAAMMLMGMATPAMARPVMDTDRVAAAAAAGLDTRVTIQVCFGASRGMACLPPHSQHHDNSFVMSHS